ncbi:MAG: N-acetylmuramoyl-L-alanine amidase [Solirubrobacteraceae bacterium]
MRRLAILLVTAGVTAWLAGPALSSAPVVPRAVDFDQGIGRDAATARAGGWHSGVIDAPKRFDLVGLSWHSSGDVGAWIRVRDAASARWSRWTPMAGDHGGGRGTEPVWDGGSDALQLRLTRYPRGLRAQFVNATGTATPVKRALTGLRRVVHDGYLAITGTPALAQGAHGRPQIIPREAWGADQCKPRADPIYGDVQAAVVHHTVDANGYARGESAAIVLAICRFHRNSRGWYDIGYNFLVDRFGQVFEGRAGGVDQPVIGAQAEGYNAATTGIANIGTYSGVAASLAAAEATAQLLAWKLSLHGVPLVGQAGVRSAGGATNRHRAGALVTVQRIGGHRDLDRTSCPGDRLVRQLAQIRRRAAELAAALPPRPAAPASVTLQPASGEVSYPRPSELRGRVLTPDGTPLGGVAVAIQIARSDGFRTLHTVTTAPDGNWMAQLSSGYTRTLRAVATLGDGARVPSALARVRVAPGITVRAHRRVVAKRRLTVSGSVRPSSAGLSLQIASKGSDRRYRTVARIALRVRSRRFSTTVRLRRPALYRLRVVSAGTARNAPGRSADLLVRATRPRR